MDRVSYAMRLVGGRIGGKYEVSRVLGIGGMGAVYDARHAYTGRRVAVKVLGPDYASSHDAVERFLQEAQAPSSIGHPNIVEVLDAGEDPQHGLYVVLEYLEGEDLEAAVERGDMDLRTMLAVTAQLLDALAAAHARGFVHRDIKPANVFLTRNRDGSLRVKLLDFGIAKNVARGLTVGNAVMGTPHYMAPEQAQGHPVDARADLWAVGAVLFHALAGVPPYDGDNPNVIMVAIIMGEVPSLRRLRPDLSKALLDVVEHALTKDLGARWQSAPQMAAALAEAPEVHGGVLKVSSTLRNRGGAVSHMRPGPPPIDRGPGTLDAATLGESFHAAPAAPRPGTGTLGPEDEARPAPPTLRAATPDRRRLVAIGALALVAVVGGALAVALSQRTPPTTAPPRPTPVRATSPTPAVANTPAPRPVAPPAPAPVVAAPSLPVVVDAAVAEREPSRGHGHRAHRATTAPEAAPSAAPTAPATQRIGGLNIGSYNAP